MRRLPILRLPTVLFPHHHPFTATLHHVDVDDRRAFRALTAPVANEIVKSGGKVAVLADGATVGTEAELQLFGDAEAHILGMSRIVLRHVDERSAAGRLGTFDPLKDEEISHDGLRRLVSEVESAQALLNGGRLRERLELCTLDEEVMLEFGLTDDPRAHPLWDSAKAAPSEPVRRSSQWVLVTSVDPSCAANKGRQSHRLTPMPSRGTTRLPPDTAGDRAMHPLLHRSISRSGSVLVFRCQRRCGCICSLARAHSSGCKTASIYHACWLR